MQNRHIGESRCLADPVSVSDMEIYHHLTALEREAQRCVASPAA